MAVLRYLNVELKLLADNFNNGLKNAQKEAKEFEKTIKPSKELAKELGLAMTAAGLAVVTSMTAMAKAAADYGDDLAKASERTGASVQELAKLKFAAEQSGAAFEDVSTGLRVLAKNMDAAATGSKAQQKTFRDIGVATKDAAGNMRPLNDVLLDVADRFAHMKDGAEKAAIAQELFGRGGTALIPTLNEGRDGLKAMGDMAERLGLVISDDAAKAGEEFNDTLDQMKMAVTGLANVIGAAILPTLTSLAEKARDVIISFKNWASVHPELTKAILGTAGAITGTGGLLLGLSALLSVAPNVVKAIQLLSSVISPMGLAIAAAAAAVILFRNEIKGALTSALILGIKGFEGFAGAVASLADKLGLSGGLGTKLHEAAFSASVFREQLERNQRVITVQAEDYDKASKKTDDFTFSLKRSADATEVSTKKLAEMRAELERDKTAFENAAKLDLFKAQTDAAEEVQRTLRINNAEVLKNAKDAVQFEKEKAESIRKINIDVQDDINEQLRLSNKIALDDIKRQNDARKAAAEEEKRRLKQATEDVKRAAGAIFDDMFIKGENVLTSLKNAVKGGALSLGRALFEDVVGNFLGPVKKAIDDFIQQQILSKLGGLFSREITPGGMRTLAGGATGAAGSVGGAAGSAGGGVGSAAGSAGSLLGSVSQVAGIAGAAGSIVGAVGTLRLEGTMNAVEFNTRASRIHLEVIINEFLHPFKTSLEWILHHAETHTNELDAIYNLLNSRLTGVPSAAYAGASSSPQMVSTVGPTTITINMPVTTTGDPVEFAAKVRTVLKSALKTDRDGVRSDVILAASQNRGLASSLPQG